MKIEELLTSIEHEEKICNELTNLLEKVNSVFFIAKYPKTKDFQDNHGCSWGDDSINENINKEKHPKLFNNFKTMYIDYLKNELFVHQTTLNKLLDKKIMIENMLEDF